MVRSKLRALAVEDSPAGRKLLRAFLASSGCTVSVCGDGRAALELHRARAFDVIVSDWVMPRLDGHGLLRELRGAGDDVPVLLVSGHRDEKTRRLCLALGRVAWLEKPLVLAELRESLDTLLARQASPS